MIIVRVEEKKNQYLEELNELEYQQYSDEGEDDAQYRSKSERSFDFREDVEETEGRLSEQEEVEVNLSEEEEGSVEETLDASSTCGRLPKKALALVDLLDPSMIMMWVRGKPTFWL